MTDTSHKKLNIHFILPGGGVRGAFQAGFLYYLFTNYSDFFTVARIDGTSVGSMNGLCIMNGKYEILKNTWLNIESINDLFNNWSDGYVLGKYYSFYQGFYKNGLFSNEKLNLILKDSLEENWNTLDADWKEKYSCAVVNVNTAKCEYIKGNDPHIFDFVTASASPWIVTNPVKINDCLYSDGGLLETYPYKYLGECDADMTLIIGYDQEHFQFLPAKNENLLEFLATLIDIARFNSHNTQLTKEYIKRPDVISIANPMDVSFVNFNKTTILEGFSQGCEFAENFYQTYIHKK